LHPGDVYPQDVARFRRKFKGIISEVDILEGAAPFRSKLDLVFGGFSRGRDTTLSHPGGADSTSSRASLARRRGLLGTTAHSQDYQQRATKPPTPRSCTPHCSSLVLPLYHITSDALTTPD